MAKTVTLDFLASQFVDQKVAAGEAATADAFVSQLVAEKRAQELAYDRWFRDKVMKGIAEADAGDFATPEEVEATLRRWR
jgi:predicted transcriptional regulator